MNTITNEVNEIFSRMTISVNFNKQNPPLIAAEINTPLGPMLAIADEKALYLLEFINRKNLPTEIEQLTRETQSIISFGNCHPLQSINKELRSYFAGSLQQFNTPIYLSGTPFQKQVWSELKRIPFGQTRSYLEQAQAINKPTAYRAVANANGANQLAIVIPCHRVINHNGKLGGYGGGIDHKKWLLAHEKSIINNF